MKINYHRTFIRVFLIAVGIVFSIVAGPHVALAGAHLGVSGYQSVVHAELQKTNNSVASASISFDLFDMMRLGYTYRLESETTSGKRISNTAVTDLYVSFRNVKEVTKQSIDLTIVPFMTGYIVPFIFGGIAKKDYVYRVLAEDVNDNNEISVQIKAGEGGNPPWGWNAGLGVKIPVNKDFSIKITQTYSEGIKKVNPDDVGEKVWDTYTEYGITYSL